MDIKALIRLLNPGIMGMTIAAVMVTTAFVLAWATLAQLKADTRKGLGEVLTASLNSTHEGLHIWEEERRAEAISWAGNAGLVELIKAQIAVPRDQEALLASPALADMRALIGPMLKEKNFNGFFVITPDRISIASMRDANVGTQNLLTAQGGFLDAVFAGHTRISLPMLSDVPLQGGYDTTMFVAAPIHNAAGEVIAAFTLRIFPTRHFTRMVKLGRWGQTGETYIFDASGRMVSESRFDRHLQQIGLLKEGERGILNIDIRDPGGNMVEGYRPMVARARQPLTLMAASAIKGESGQNTEGYHDYRGVPVVGTWRWDPVMGYGIATEIDVAEAYQAYFATRHLVIMILTLTVFLALAMLMLAGTTQRRGEARLREREKRYRTVLDTSMAAFMAIDRDSRVLVWNRQAENMFGWKKKKALGRPMPELIIPERSREMHYEGIKQFLETGESSIINHRIEVMALRSDGTEFPVELTVTAMSDNGSYIFNGFIRDLSERRRAEAERIRLSAAVRGTKEGVIITDREGVIEYVNPAFEHISGYSAAEAVGKTPGIVKSGEHPPEYYAEMWKHITAGKPWNGIFTNRRKDGKTYQVDQVISPILGAGEAVTGYVAVQRDVTREKTLQAQMEHTQRLESLGVMAGGIAHDFNNLLTSIMGNAALAEQEMKATSPAMEYIEQIGAASKQAANLCKQMLAYSGKGRFVVKPLDLSTMVEDMLGLLKVSIAKHAELHCRLDKHICAVDADEAQMQQVLMNLVINASEAIGEERGSITITTNQMHVDREYLEHTYMVEDLPEGDYVYLEVSDTGCGMDAQTREKIFDPFFTTKFTGRGLGMSAIMGIVRGHKGTIKVYSEEGRGTTFKLLFPCSKKKVSDDTIQKTVTDWSGLGTVLVVDDEPAIRQVAARMLENMGYKVLQAADGEEGVSVYKQHRNQVKAVLLDMTMPNMNGEECFHELRKINPDVNVILSSGYNEHEATNSFAGKGLAGFVQKPYTLKTLRGKIREVLG